MPSGYTSDIYDGKDVSFRDFVTSCAREMGAFYHMRDEPSGVPLTRMVSNEHYEQRMIFEIQQEYHDFTALDEYSQRELWKVYVDEQIESDKVSEEKRKTLRKRYADMLAQVLSWDAPESLKTLRDFMEKQLRDSIDFDTRPYDFTAPLEFEEWRDKKISRMDSNLDYYDSCIEKQRKRIKEQHLYYDDLMNALD
jgi:hypothetical protein